MKKLTFVAMMILVIGFAGVSVAANSTANFSKPVNLDKPAPADHPEGWKPLDRTGGEDCGSATVIPGLPYSDIGTTAGAIDDYDEACPYSGSTSGDVVYSFTPAAAMAIDITLCDAAAVTDYDTKLFVYENTCPDGGPFACVDDSCTAPLGTGYESSILGLTLTAGNTYYIVIDGYGGAVGNYTIDVTEGVIPEFPVCDQVDLLYGQDPDHDDYDWSFASSTQALWAAPGYAVYDDVQSDYFEVCDVHFYGLSLMNNGSWNACDPTADGGMPFTIGFYGDAAGQPDTAALICEYTGVVPDVIEPTDGSFIGFSQYRFDVNALPSCCELPASGTVWMLVQNEPMVGDCAFLWASSGNGPTGNSYQYDADLGTWTNTTYERGMCITGTTWPVELQSFSIE